MESKIATFGAGCFWGVEYEFRKLPGVIDTAVGYMGGHTDNPSYQQVCSGRTGHTEVVQIEYDPDKISYSDLLEKFWQIHDPTQVERQGPDVGYQYRSVIFYHDKQQAKQAEKSKSALADSGQYDEPVSTSIEPAQTFWRAEDYHQRYIEKTGRHVC